MGSTTTTIGSSCLLWKAVCSPPPPPLNYPLSVCVSKPPRVAVVVRADSRGLDRASTEQKWVTKGLITESLPNGMFWVRLDNGDVVLGYISGKIRRNSIRMLAGDKVKIEVSRYDSTRGRIVYRIANKDS